MIRKLQTFAATKTVVPRRRRRQSLFRRSHPCSNHWREISEGRQEKGGGEEGEEGEEGGENWEEGGEREEKEETEEKEEEKEGKGEKREEPRHTLLRLCFRKSNPNKRTP